MKKVIQPNVRKVYGPSNQQESQMNAVRKINNLLSSGSVTLTGPTQPRILKQKVSPSNASNMSPSGVVNENQGVSIQMQVHQNINRCYVCDEVVGTPCSLLSDAITSHSNTKLANKIGQIVGSTFVVIVSTEDVVCKRCTAMINHLDRIENDLERVKTNILGFMQKKYSLTEDDTQSSGVPSSPPFKTQKLNSGGITNTKLNDEDGPGWTRKIPVQNVQIRDSLDNQLSSVFDDYERQVTTIANKPKAVVQGMAQPQIKKIPVKIYRCMSCDFQTSDLKLFQPHFDACKLQSGVRCKICKKLFATATALRMHMAEKHSNEQPTCSVCNLKFLNIITLKKHMETNHSEIKTAEQPITAQMYTCSICHYKTIDKQNYDEHQKKHIKVKPFKCRICSLRFESREQASTHAKTHQQNIFRCNLCQQAFPQKEMIKKHYEMHHSPGLQQQQQQNQLQTAQRNQVLTTQKLLQETIDEALRESADNLEPKGIQFFSCNVCSLTFIQESYYKQHMESHKTENKKASITGSPSSTSSQSLIRQEVRNTNANILTTTNQTGSISEADIESIFEKMHSDKAEKEANSGNNENLVITSQENAVGGITYNITIPQPDGTTQLKEVTNEQIGRQTPPTSTSGTISVGIDMPVLDNPEDNNQQNSTDQKDDMTESEQQEHVASGSVNMPSLDDDGDSQSQPSNTDQVPMELEDIQNSAEGGGQIKFILNENGQLLQLDNHIITTDAEGNQIFVHSTDSEQIQHLLQSVGVLQAGDGLEGGTLQMIGDNNQMIIVQQGDNEAQLIDASLLNADGHIVIQQAQDGELSEDQHAMDEEDVRIPVAYTAHDQQQDNVGLSDVGHGESQELSEQQVENVNQQSKNDTNESGTEQKNDNHNTDESVNPVTSVAADESSTSTTTQSLPTTGSEGFFALEDLMQQSDQKANE